MIHTLEADGIQLEFGYRKILTDVYIKCQTGSITGFLGRNGQGKTCLMNIIYGSMQPSIKSVRFDGVFVHKAYKRADLLTYLPQFNFIPSALTIKRVFSDFNLSFADFETYFPEFNQKQSSTLANLSGGQRRLVEVYTIIKSKAKFSMLDEPFSHIMPLHIDTIKEMLQAEKSNKGFLITDHMYHQIIDVCDPIYVVANGKVHLTKNTDDIERLGYVRFDWD